ncbi:MAG: 2-C-methyl-D-erythritol 4-phosphate cytidylyltransferase [Deferribacteraceae bacterium]|jgi:2-C-methyl-D-erythritol 4-phosphate cytidylyltransferase|nr:2-C-methyl-D-erythritol 4-phosphate cytidylyltransferase [Deferribacteraceae bacterium]
MREAPQRTVSAIIPAAGSGKRYGGKKQFVLIDGIPVLKITLNALRNAYPFNEYIIGIADEDRAFIEALDLGSDVIFSPGGPNRAATVINALKRSKCDFVAVHDAVRPFVSAETVKKCVYKAFSDGAAICGLFAVDTVKLVKDAGVVSTVERDAVFLAHTPQVFEREKLLKALNFAVESGQTITDEASAYEFAGYSVSITLSDKKNIKITYSEDI